MRFLCGNLGSKIHFEKKESQGLNRANTVFESELYRGIIEDWWTKGHKFHPHQGLFYSFYNLKLTTKVCKSYYCLLRTGHIAIKYQNIKAGNDSCMKIRNNMTKIFAVCYIKLFFSITSLDYSSICIETRMKKFHKISPALL